MSPMVRRPPEMELALLGFLLQGPQHGYQIHQKVSDPSGLGLIWKIKQSQLYALLTKLEEDGYVTSTFQSQGKHPPRRIFELTLVGRKTFFEWLTSPVSAPRLIRQIFFAKFYFLQNENTAEIQTLIQRQCAICENWIMDIQARLEESKDKSFSQHMYRYRLGQIKSFQQWLNSWEF